MDQILTKLPVIVVLFLQCFDLFASQRSSSYCSDERELPNGYVTYSVGRFYSQTQLVTGVKKRFECHRGWTLVGSQTAECRRGRWSARTPRCSPDSCEALTEDANNYLTVYYSEDPEGRGNYPSGTEAHVYCNFDTILVSGDGYPVCINGAWLPQIPLCLHRDFVDESCIFKESDLADGVVVTNFQDIKEGGVVNHFGVLEFRCVPGYTLSGSDITTCIDSRWSQPFPVCNPDDDYGACGQTSGNTQSRAQGNRARGKRVRVPRLVGGFDANDATWPWQAALYWLNSYDQWSFLCGGTLISPEWILSAAHCFQREENIQKIQVRLGLTHRVRHGNRPREQKHTIDGLYINKNYNFRSFDYDVALLHLSRRAALNPFVRTVCLPEVPTASNYDNSIGLVKPDIFGMVIGWGHSSVIHFHNSSDSDGRTYNKKLQQLEVPIKANKTCVNSLKKHGESVGYYTERMFCAGYSKRSRGPCFGDSGGPVVRMIQTPVAPNSTEVHSRWVQIGIVSNTATGCAVKGVYTLYTHVPYMMDWIDEVLHMNHTAPVNSVSIV